MRLDIILWVPDGSTWPVQYIFRTVKGHIRAEINKGWRAFSLDNSLKVGDVCVFESIKGVKVSFIVKIFRAAEDANCFLSPGTGGQVTQRPSSSRASTALGAASKFISENPFFTIRITSDHLKCVTAVPRAFVRKHLPKEGSIKKYTEGSAHTVMLQVANRSWPVKLILYPHSDKFSAGWSAFIRDNTLRVGDVCIFELIKRDDVVLKVNIFRCLT
uniref:TF-B3 domain-containing protein n=1 Tax=Fagus sylvatica TaxID=28930 RepID=A0A2N9HNY1_FAGSY